MLVAYLLFEVVFATLRTSAAIPITLIQPLVETVLAVAVAGDRLAIVGWVGLVFILAGVAPRSAARHPDK
jgi:DME family drug/metabolite transporter